MSILLLDKKELYLGEDNEMLLCLHSTLWWQKEAYSTTTTRKSGTLALTPALCHTELLVIEVRNV